MVGFCTEVGATPLVASTVIIHQHFPWNKCKFVFIKLEHNMSGENRNKIQSTWSKSGLERASYNPD